MKFFALLPFVTFILSALAVHSWRCRRAGGPASFRESLLITAVIVCAWAVLGTELLGSLSALSFWPVLMFWLTPIPAAITELSSRPKNFSFAQLFCFKFPAGQRFLCWLLVALCAIILLLAFVTALVSPQNNPDALAYHVPRIIFWMQQHSLANFPTSDPFQLFMPPLTEYLGLNLMILGNGSDWALNLIPFGCLVLLAVAAAETVEFFQRDLAAQLLGALLMLSIPTAFVFATAFKPELLLCLWLLILTLWLMRIAIVRRCSAQRLVLIAAAFGLLALTAGIGYICGLPLAVLCVVALFRCSRLRDIDSLALIAAFVLLINGPFFARNLQEFGSPLGPINSTDPHNQFVNAVFTPQGALTNLLRNTGPMFSGPIDQIDQTVDWVVGGIAHLFSLNLQDPHITFPGPVGSTSYDGAHYFPGNENRITWPFHMLLFLLIPVGLWLRRKEPLAKVYWWWLTLPLAILLVFSALLRWHPAEAHLLLPIPVLLVPLAALTVASFRPALLRAIIAVGAAIWLLPPILLFPRTLFGSQAVEFQSRIYELNGGNRLQAKSVEDLIGELSTLPQHPDGLLIGLYLPASLPFAYSLQAPLLDALHPRPRFTYFNADVEVPVLSELDPDVVISPEKVQWLRHQDTGTKYKLWQKVGLLYVYVPDTPRPSAPSNR
ncbi:MAG TPA: hypothetical protein VMG59_05170 [Phycisphaerae bacterium]|nr:hypothetical protein [Phycisphaerae bacterium]